MAKKALVFQSFEGGISTDSKVGIKNSQAYVQALDFRKSPSQMSVLPGLTREDGGVVRDLIINETMVKNGQIVAYGNSGYIYRRSTGGSWSVEGKLGSGAFGMDYRQDNDSIYFATSKSVSLYNAVTTTPTLLADTYASSKSTFDGSQNAGFNVNANQSNSANSTNILVATSPLTEGAPNVRFFQSDIEPLNKISVYIISKGTGNWTLTLHDGLNNVLATSTVTNANLNNNAFNDFAFTTATNGQVRVYVNPNARTYHIHVTSTVADGTVSSLSSNDLTSCDLQVWADRLIQTNNGLHPIARFLQFEVIGNANYLSTWEPLDDPPTNAAWQRHRLVFPQEYEVCGLAVQNEFIVVAAEKNTSLTTSIPQAGILFFWDGTSDTYNYFVEVPEGTPYCLHSYKNVTYYFAGGAWWAITSPTTLPVKLRTMPGSDTEFSGSAAPIVIYPAAATVRRGIHLMAYPSTTTNTSINFGVYSWGAVDKNFPDSLGYNYLISTGSQNYSAQNNLSIGLVQSYGDTLHVSWRDDLNGGYGIDVITNASKPAAYAKWQGLIFDNGYVGKPKDASYMEAYFNLPAGATIALGYSIDGSSFTTSPAYSTTSLWNSQVGYARFNISANGSGRFRQIQLQLEVTCDTTVTTPPIVQMVSLVFDDKREEVLI